MLKNYDIIRLGNAYGKIIKRFMILRPLLSVETGLRTKFADHWKIMMEQDAVIAHGLAKVGVQG